jgi:hypothetical protein
MAWSSARVRFALKPMKVLIFSALALSISGNAASAGFLDELFGPDPAPQAMGPARAARGHYAAPTRERGSRQDYRVKSEVHFMPASARKDHHSTTVAKTDDSASSAGSKPLTAALCAPEATVAGAPAASLLAYDKTLRNGDIMVTDNGVQIFRGHAACPHNSRDFVALSSASMPRGQRSMLLAIEDAMKRPSGYLVTAKVEKH